MGILLFSRYDNKTITRQKVRMFTLLKNPSSPSDLIESSARLYRASLRYVYACALLSTFFFLLPVYWHYLKNASFFSATETQNSVSYLLYFLSWLISSILMTGVLFNLHCFCHGIKNTSKQMIIHCCSRFITVLLTLASYLIIILSGTALLIIPGFILSVSLLFSFLMVVNENKNVLQSLISSHQLVWENWWHTFIVISVPFILNLSLTLLCFLALMKLFPLPVFEKQWFILSFMTQLILQSILLPLTFSVAITLFNDLRIRQHRNKQLLS